MPSSRAISPTTPPARTGALTWSSCVSYGDDIRKVKRILEEIIAADERVLQEPAPVVALGELAATSVNFLVRPWAKTGDYWQLMWDTMEAVKLRFDEEGITIPLSAANATIFWL